MKVAFSTYNFPPLVGGIATYAIELTERIKGTVFKPGNLKHCVGEVNVYESHPSYKGATYKNAWKIIKYRKEKFDIIHALEIQAVYPAYILARLQRTKLVLTIHGNDFLYAMKRRWNKFLLTRVLNYCHKIITVSNNNKEMILKEYPHFKDKLIVINPGVSERFYKVGVKPQKKIILYVGALKKLKGIDTLIKAFKLLEGYELHIVGKGEDEEYLKDLAKDNKAIKFFGTITDKEELCEKYSEAEVLVIPSRFALEGETESFGIVFLEANACGTPCISYKLGGIPDAFGPNTGILLDDYSPEALAKAIKKIDKKSMSDDCIKWAKKFTWDKQIEKIKEVYI